MCGSCIVVYGGCSCGNSCIGGGGLQYGGQISSLIIMSSLLLSNVGVVVVMTDSAVPLLVQTHFQILLIFRKL